MGILKTKRRFGLRGKVLKKALRRFRLQETPGKIWSRQAAEKANLRILSVADFAREASYSRRTIQKRAQQGKLEAFKQAGKWWILTL